ncbi:hypothetical protein AV530_003239 [Patagioenas fasciata monilis]|uniref:Uncharacterized protein n=1 Tax=Patagioenas fasciata monilis TaxID=372326 RepID=A0A1V4KWP2_PATFA|nr:hypothetical protein AV530_003239 [Patagioenas fasciata monilis]
MFALGAWCFKDLAQIMEVQLINSAGGNHSLLHFTAAGGPRQTQNIIKDRALFARTRHGCESETMDTSSPPAQQDQAQVLLVSPRL